MNLFAAPLTSYDLYSEVLRHATADPALRLEARRRLRDALDQTSGVQVAVALGITRDGLRKLFQADVWPEVAGQRPMCEWVGRPGRRPGDGAKTATKRGLSKKMKALSK